MDINQSTADGQSQIIENLFSQANIGDPADTPGVEDIGEHVIFMHGDLGTGERLHSVKKSRSIESTRVRRLQPVVFVMGLFHLQMSAADAIWKMFIEPTRLRTDPDGLYQHACRARPHESGKIGSKPGFRLMHDLIYQCGNARMLDVWRVEAQKRNRSHTSLSDFAASKPTWDYIVAMSLKLVESYLDKPFAKDKLYRNNSLILARLLQYMELSHAMKHGDIGRVQETFMHWVAVFKTVGKHKYATELITIMNNLKYVFPPRMAYAFLMNWLCNPTGKPDGFRAIDWVVELMNLFTKVVYGSSGYTRTLLLIIKQSPLIETFRKIHTLMQDNFHLLHRSVRHAPPNIQNTITALRELLEKTNGHLFSPDRIEGLTVSLMDHYSDGMYKLQTTPIGKKGGLVIDGEADEEMGIEEELDIDDLEA
ncbi:hypothetical protein EUX98_g8113 [Antrodiella citrinella]|uniref:DUF6589 domain-containing protein n=1 Tax=Antrodiella citrinella TaxID=2447956 RepID=A0A4S4MDX2_9APHY|nr:hypothetical protein EUX98_g8113 [Antrodiella citrinella]